VLQTLLQLTIWFRDVFQPQALQRHICVCENDLQDARFLCILLVILLYINHDARFRECKAHLYMLVFFSCSKANNYLGQCPSSTVSDAHNIWRIGPPPPFMWVVVILLAGVTYFSNFDIRIESRILGISDSSNNEWPGVWSSSLFLVSLLGYYAAV